MKKVKTIAVSGGFDPVHPGHIDMIDDAARYGNVVVILNSDRFLREKKGYVFMPYSARERVMSSLKHVTRVVPCIDDDQTVCQTLDLIRPDYFANGGDRLNKASIPEAAVCKKLGIKMVFGVGGITKPYSSSELVKKVRG